MKKFATICAAIATFTSNAAAADYLRLGDYGKWSLTFHNQDSHHGQVCRLATGQTKLSASGSVQGVQNISITIEPHGAYAFSVNDTDWSFKKGDTVNLGFAADNAHFWENVEFVARTSGSTLHADIKPANNDAYSNFLSGLDNALKLKVYRMIGQDMDMTFEFGVDSAGSLRRAHAALLACGEEINDPLPESTN